MEQVLGNKAPRLSSRMLALDLLRGFFIVVIIIDHLYRWPSLLGYISGQGDLWVTAGEGFVIISGLLIGYVRGYKNRELPLLDVAKKIWKRAFLLYGWLVGLTIIYTVLAWYGHFVAPTSWVSIPAGNWLQLLGESFTVLYRHTWIYFLYFYVFLLVISPVFIYLLRRRQNVAVFALCFVGYAIGRVFGFEWMQWIPLFFLPAMAGYYLPNIQQRWTHRPKAYRRALLTLLYSLTGLTVVASVVCVFIIPSNPAAAFFNDIMTKQDHFPAWRIPISLLWFAGFAMLFDRFKEPINRFFGWLLLPFGMRSLTAYIVHGSVLFLAAATASLSPNIWYNTALGVAVIVATWLIVTRKTIQKVVPQ